ncbi:MAG TPA: hypothetical protein PKC28_16700, partial [Bdellovibrionales bacterium]|nr:hypothetical protein [Bdellovibrionales bacterium]
MLRLLIALFLVSPIAYAVTEIPCIDGLVPLEPAEIKAVTADDFIPVPEITADLTNPQEVRRLGAQMMNVLTENSRVTAQLFYGASKERDDSFKVLRGHLMRSGQDAGGADESLLGLFAKFN